MNELISLLANLVSINSVNPDLAPGGAGEAAMAEFVADWGRQNGLETHVQDAGDGRLNTVLIARGSGGGKSLMLNAHTDVVGVSGMDAPFEPRIQDGRMSGVAPTI